MGEAPGKRTRYIMFIECVTFSMRMCDFGSVKWLLLTDVLTCSLNSMQVNVLFYSDTFLIRRL